MYIGVDLGGTKIAVGIVTKEGKILLQRNSPTKAKRGAKEVINDIVKLIKELIVELNMKEKDVLGIGIGVPGPTDNNTGYVIQCVNLGWVNVPLRSMINEQLNIPVQIDNDASLAALAEHEIGSLKDIDSGVLLTLGTGIGGGIILKGNLLTGSHGVVCELGHTIVGENFYDCSCGRNGCLETFASATALIKYTKKIIKESNTSTIILDKLNGNLELLDAKIIFDAAKEGDFIAIKAIERFAKYLAIGISNLINILDPEMISIGGGVSKAGEYLMDLIRSYLYKYKAFKNVEIANINLAKLGNEAGIVGAAMLCKHL